MVTDIRRRGQRHLHLYIDEWMEKRELSDERLAGRLGVVRETVWKWRTQQNRLDPEKIARLAAALDLEEPIELFSKPERPSIDAQLANASDDLRQKVAEIVQTLLKTGT